MKFLIADDTNAKMMFLKKLIERSGFKGPILEAITTEQAEEFIDKNPDIIAAFVDYYMPTQYGPSVIRYLRKKNPHAHIALVSSANNEENSKEAKEAGADAVICTSDRGDFVEQKILELLEQWENS